MHELLDPLKADRKLDEQVNELLVFPLHLEILNSTVYKYVTLSLQFCKYFSFSSVQSLAQEHNGVCLLVGLTR